MISQFSMVHILKLGQRKQQPLQPPATTPTARNHKPFWQITGTVTITGDLWFYDTIFETRWIWVIPSFYTAIPPYFQIFYLQSSFQQYNIKILKKIFLWSVFTNFAQLLSIYPTCTMLAVPPKSYKI